ncbi:hypothetical protein AL036_17845 [Salipiger aestuarii]|uniref:Yip1-like protein n=1 Tax=Salipiger aestuarii TaxID=568098 RepID=A0A327XPD6_9RHOB|nr:hypothetical protein [Salipiger aestuarii]EIE51417.1 hypothetical protein C357_08905 [Citreicella sp. 357]KAA8605662.1 hypothetical protein AL036_17845 [Salipiger aestuarii]KAA8612826.1 hypothetical protein AL037_06795 [Salipiger aestuarii]KAB2539852.1 hypothetical protein AL035_17575 [Salipiger aestuarii]RAK10968.1 hypothetical protein ATI53_10534 [Salipiger aestuarii]
MTVAALGRLALDTLMTPRDVATRILSLGLSREAVLTVFALAVVLNGIMSGLVLVATDTATLPIALGPWLVTVVFAAILGTTIWALGWIGRGFGGGASTLQIALLVSWVQILRAFAQLAILVAGAVFGSAATVLAVAVIIAGAWVLAHFVDVAHGFGDPWKAAMVLIMAFVVTAFALIAVMASFDITPQTVANHV